MEAISRQVTHFLSIWTPSRLWHRRLGAIGLKTFRHGTGIRFLKCRRIHTFFMRFAVDAIGLDETERVIEIYRRVMPWRIINFSHRVKSIVEVLGETTVDWETGDALSITNVSNRRRLMSESQSS